MIWNNCSSMGSAPPTSMAVTMPLPIAKTLWMPIIVQSVAAGSKRLIGPIKPKVRASSQIPRPTQSPARISRLRRRTVWVNRTAVKPLIKPIASIGASILFKRMLLKRLTKTAP